MRASRKHLGIAALAALAGWLTIAAPVFADVARPAPAPQPQGKPADKGKPDDKGKPAEAGKPAESGKPDDKGKPQDSPAASGTASAGAAASASAAAPGKDPEKVRAERKERAKKDRDELKKKVQEKLANRPMAQAMKEELARHARRVARILRVKEVAQTENDDDAVQRADKLLAKENARHDKWMASYDAKGDAKGGGK